MYIYRNQKKTAFTDMRLYCWSSFSLNALNYTAAIFHLIQAAIVLGVIQHLNQSMENREFEKYGLNNGVFKITKNNFIITSVSAFNNKNNDGLILSKESIKQNEAKCSMSPVSVFNSSLSLGGGGLQKGNETHQDSNNISMALFSAFNLFKFHWDVIMVERDDIFMFDTNDRDEKYYVIPQTFHAGDLDIRYIIFSFFLLSGLFQLADGFMGAYTNTSSKQPRLLRFVEYSFSASIMILAIAVETGVNDIYTLYGIFTLIFTTNLLGLIAEIFCFIAEGLLSNGDGAAMYKINALLPIPLAWLWTIPHFLGWVTCIIGYSPLLDSYLHSTKCSDRGPPGFVHVIVFLEFVLFSCFGFVQLYSLYYRTLLVLNPVNRLSLSYSTLRQGTISSDVNFEEEKAMNSGGGGNIAEQADYMYILLSFIAKTLLAWLILSPALMN